MIVSIDRNAPIRVGIVGLGRAGWDIHARMLLDDSRYAIAAAADPDSERQREAESRLGCAAYASAETMLQAQPLDLVVVASPSMCHLPHTLMALDAGSHVVVEKPLGMNTAEVDRMIDAAQSAGRWLMPYQPRRLTPLHRRLRQVMRSGLLGRITHLAYRRYNYIRRDDWQCVLAYGGGMLSNHGSHVLDQVIDLLQSPVEQVLCRLDNVASVGDAEDHVTLLLQTASHVTVHVEISDGAATPESLPEWTLIGEYGALTATGKSGRIRFFDPATAPPTKLQAGLAARGRVYGTRETLPWEDRSFSVEGEPDTSYYDAVFDSLAGGRPFVFPVDQVREVIALLDRCRSQNPRFLRPVPPVRPPQAPAISYGTHLG